MDEIKKDGQFIKELTEASIDARGRALNRRKINKPFVNSYKKISICVQQLLVQIFDIAVRLFFF